MDGGDGDLKAALLDEAFGPGHERLEHQFDIAVIVRLEDERLPLLD